MKKLINRAVARASISRRFSIQRAQMDADLAQRRFMLVDTNNRLVADTLEAEWNDKLRALAQAREDGERDERLAPGLEPREGDARRAG